MKVNLLFFVLMGLSLAGCGGCGKIVDQNFKGFIYKRGNIRYILKDETADLAFSNGFQRLIICMDKKLTLDTTLSNYSSWQFDSLDSKTDLNAILLQTRLGENNKYDKDSIFILNKKFKIGYTNRVLNQTIYTVSDSCTRVFFAGNKVGFFLYKEQRQIFAESWNIRFRGFNNKSNEVYVYDNDNGYPMIFALTNSSNSYNKLLNYFK